MRPRRQPLPHAPAPRPTPDPTPSPAAPPTRSHREIALDELQRLALKETILRTNARACGGCWITWRRCRPSRWIAASGWRR